MRGFYENFEPYAWPLTSASCSIRGEAASTHERSSCAHRSHCSCACCQPFRHNLLPRSPKVPKHPSNHKCYHGTWESGMGCAAVALEGHAC